MLFLIDVTTGSRFENESNYERFLKISSAFSEHELIFQRQKKMKQKEKGKKNARVYTRKYWFDMKFELVGTCVFWRMKFFVIWNLLILYIIIFSSRPIILTFRGIWMGWFNCFLSLKSVLCVKFNEFFHWNWYNFKLMGTLFVLISNLVVFNESQFILWL